MIYHEGFYYYSESRYLQPTITIRRSRTIATIGQDPGICVWRAPKGRRNSHAIWAPELHRVGSKWFIYYAADDGRNENHRMWVLESEGDDPLGKYHCRGELLTGGWAIDGTLLTVDDKLFCIWSGWPGRRNGKQNLYIAPMSDPVTLAGPRTLICTPDQPWESVAMPICEGPQVLKRNGDVFIVYSASGSWTPDYCLGLLHNQTGDVINPSAWKKRGPVFQKNDQVWGVGHCSFVKSLCQTEDWLIYHAKSSREYGWSDRDVHAKQFVWTQEGLPDFGTPPPRRAPVASVLSKSVGTGPVPLAA
ncbi:MAG: Alpha-N-arabinofuranosidase [Pedosphaera sp.]|nr:Alpha-N-arabinofuranosidase [Pedosphaera sp.]